MAGAGNHGGCNQGVGYVYKRRLEVGKMEGLDNNIRETLCSAVGNLCQEADEEDQPGLGVDQALYHLIPSPG